MREDDSLRRAIDEPVRIIPYDPAWPQKFEEEKRRLRALFPEAFVAVEHIGSTAIPGLSAKPVIDVMAGVRSMPEADALLPGLGRNGYTTSAEFNATLVDRRWLMRHEQGRRTHHLHLVIFRSETWRNRINFRERLRTDIPLAREYKELKLSLAKTVGVDREMYTSAKSKFIEKAIQNRS